MMLWHNPTKVIFGRDSVGQLKELGYKNVVIISGRTAMRNSGILKRLGDMFDSVHVYDKVEPNPVIERVNDCIDYVGKLKPEAVIAVGGGSAIDVGKCAARLTGHLDAYDTKPVFSNETAMVAIPTTSGSGSEVTQYASLSDKKNNQKFSLSNEALFPDTAIVDPVLCTTMPREVTAATGLDALSQAIESYWSVNSTPLSRPISEKAMDTIYHNLKNAYDHGDNLDFRESMALGSLLAGIGISQTKTTAVHAASYPLTLYHNIPHGIACALTLPSFVRFNESEELKKITGYFDATDVEEMARNIEMLIEALNVPARLGSFGITEKDIYLLVKNGFRPDRVKNNPKLVTEEDLYNILLGIL